MTSCIVSVKELNERFGCSIGDLDELLEYGARKYGSNAVAMSDVDRWSYEGRPYYVLDRGSQALFMACGIEGTMDSVSKADGSIGFLFHPPHERFVIKLAFPVMIDVNNGEQAVVSKLFFSTHQERGGLFGIINAHSPSHGEIYECAYTTHRGLFNAPKGILTDIVVGLVSYVTKHRPTVKVNKFRKNNPSNPMAPGRTTYRVSKIDIDDRIVEHAEECAAVGRQLNHTFIVRGHYRWQPCGSGREDRRVTWIDPYWKGPARTLKVATMGREYFVQPSECAH